uniref:rab-like protein 6 n=1 Tax=Panthera onca TaxID=9690 RepID=UPI0029548CD7|nr:rab-like protein 6 [Panthera onca]
MMEARSRGHASPLAANGQSPSSGSQSPVVPPSTVSTGSSSPSTPQPAPQLPLQPPSACPCPPAPAEAPPPPAAPAPRRSIISRLFGTSPAAEAAPSSPEPAPASEAPAKVQNVEDFVPEDGLDRSFLDDTAPRKEEKKVEAKVSQDSDSDGEAPGGNPLVAGFQDDVGLEDRPPAGPVPRRDATASEEEAAGMAGHTKATAATPQKCAEPETKRPSTQASRPPRAVESRRPGVRKSHRQDPSGGREEKRGEQVASSSSSSDPEGPIAAQMLSFVMDDPDFESDSDTQRKAEEFPVREDLSDDTDEDARPAQPPPPPKPPVSSFRLKNDSDLFGLGPEETGHKEISDEGS